MGGKERFHESQQSAEHRLLLHRLSDVTTSLFTVSNVYLDYDVFTGASVSLDLLHSRKAFCEGSMP